MSAVAAAIAGGAYLSYEGSRQAGNRAERAQQRGVQQGNEILREQTGQANQALRNAYDEQKSIFEPYSEAGVSSLSQLQSGDFAKNLEMDPGYQFRLKQGQNALRGGASAQGNLNSGATLKALERYGQDYASNEYQNAYQRNYDRLSQLAGLGYNAKQNQFNASGSYGNSLSNNMMSYGNQVSNNFTGLGNAQAANQIAQQNSQNQLLGSLAGAAGMYYGGRK